MGKIFIKSIPALFLAIGMLFVFGGDLRAANEDRAANYGASPAVIESKIREQAEEGLEATKPLQKVELEEEPAPEAPATGPSFFVKKIRLEGDVMLESQEYEPLLQKFENRELRFDELQRLINALEQLFRAKGYIAVVLLPPQKMENQEVLLKAVTSRMGQLSVEKNRYYAGWRTRSYWKTRQGEILR